VSETQHGYFCKEILQKNLWQFRFVTFTGNPNWPEVVAALPEGQTWEDRPDIVCRIFIDKVAVFVTDMVKRKVLGNVGAWAYSVEHQKCGQLLF
jgi:hypothetical protein